MAAGWWGRVLRGVRTETRNEASDVQNLVQAHVVYGDVHFHGGSPRRLYPEGGAPIHVSYYQAGECAKHRGNPEYGNLIPSELAIHITVEGKSDQAVILQELRAIEVERKAPDGSRYECCRSRKIPGADMPRRAFDLDFDDLAAVQSPRTVDFPFKVTAGDPEVFLLRPKAWGSLALFRLELRWTCLGQEGKVVIGDTHNRFILYPQDGPFTSVVIR